MGQWTNEYMTKSGAGGSTAFTGSDVGAELRGERVWGSCRMRFLGCRLWRAESGGVIGFESDPCGRWRESMGRVISTNRRCERAGAAVAPAVLCFMLASTPLLQSEARDLLLQKEQEVTQFGEIHVPALDQKNWKRPQGMFSWITMACGWEVPQDKYGREGWFGNPRIRPKVPGVSVFPVDTAVVYVVFEIPSLDAPMQMNTDWFRVNEQGNPSGKPLGKDSQFMDMNEGYGYLEVRHPQGGWKRGEYLVKIYISSPGQQIHALSQVGTMQFAINDAEEAVQTGARCRAAGPQLD